MKGITERIQSRQEKSPLTVVTTEFFFLAHHMIEKIQCCLQNEKAMSISQSIGKDTNRNSLKLNDLDQRSFIMVKKSLNPVKIDYKKRIVENRLLQIRNDKTVDLADPGMSLAKYSSNRITTKKKLTHSS